MRREVGLSAGFLALVAVFVHSFFRPEGANSGAATPQEQSQSDKELKVNVPGEAPDTIEGPWLATREFFHTPENFFWPCKQEKTADRPKSDLIFPFCELDKGDKKSGDFTSVTRRLFGVSNCAGPIHVIIATVPDPVHSRLALSTDEQIETIERALHEGQWEFATQWLPWNDVLDPTEGNVSKRRYERYLLRLQQQLPGIVVFRRAAAKRTSAPESVTGCLSEPEQWKDRPEQVFSRESLFVFIVGETPTAGINGRAFRAARLFADALMRPSDELGILAPTFSGSFYSLTTLLSTESKPFRPHIHVYSGTVSSKDYGELFHYHTGIDFHSGSHNSKDIQRAFCAVLSQYHIDQRDAANLMEDETAYGHSIERWDNTGRSSEEPCPKVSVYYFPREISHLRNAYRDVAGEAQRSTYDPLAGLEFSLRDPETGEDSIPVYSQQQTPQTQNAIVEQLTTEFNRRRLRLVNITATNILDLLFLAHMIRLESPDTRVLISDAQALFIPAATNASLTGALFLSTYPMSLSMTGLPHLTNSGRIEDVLPFDKSHVFAHAGYQGLFNVTQFLLHDMNLLSLPLPSRDYGHAHDSTEHWEDHPPLWLLTVNRYGFFPLERINLVHDDHKNWMPLDPGKNSHSAKELHFLRPARSWMIAEGLLAIAILVFCVMLILANAKKSLKLPLWLTLRTGSSYFAARCLSLFAVLLVLSASQWILVLPVATAVRGGKYLEEDQSIVWTYVVFGVFAFFAPVVAIYCLLPLWKLRKEFLRRKHLLHSAGFCLLCLTYAAILWAWSGCVTPNDSQADYFNIRGLEIYSGSSPAVPLLLLFAAFLFVALSSFRRYSLGLNEPYLPTGPVQRQDIDTHVAEVHRQVVKPLDLTSLRGGLTVAAILFGCALAAALLHRYAYFSAFEQGRYNDLLVFGELAVFALLALGCVHIVQLWRAFEVMLTDFESSVYMESIIRVTRSWPRRPIWASGKFIRDPAFERQSLLALHNRSVIGGAEKATQFQTFLDAVRTMRAACVLHCSFDEISATTRKYYQLCRDIAEDILKRDLYPYWLSHVIGERLTVRSPEQAPDPEEICVRAGADFVVLQMARYFVFVAMQTQQIAWALSVIMVILLLTFNAYTPQAPQTIGRLMAICFVIIGFFVVRVFAGMERNPILSRIAGTRPGKLNWEFYTHILALGILPLIGVLAHLYPAIGNFVFSWVTPGIESAH